MTRTTLHMPAPPLELTAPEPGRAPGDPKGRVQGFIDRVGEIYGRGFVQGWLSRATCDFSHDEIRTTALGAATLRKRCSLIAAKFKIRIIVDGALEARLAANNRNKRG